LSLAEVQVFEGTNNLARRGEASQSSTAFDGPARLAIDGNTDGDYNGAKSTTHTEQSENPWWEVDLKAASRIERIVLWNRTDGNLESRLSEFRLAVLNEKREPVWETSVKEPPKPSSAFNLDFTPVRFAAAFADSNPSGSDVKSVIAEPGKKPKAGWSVEPDGSKNHYLTLLPGRPLEVGPGSTLQVTLE